MLTENATRNTQHVPREVEPDEIGPVDQARCDDCPPERVCAWDCEQGQGVLEILMGEALTEQARLTIPIGSEPTQQALYDIYT